MKSDGKGKRVLVVGASSGIGLAVAQLLEADGFGVIAHGRDSSRLDRFENRLIGDVVDWAEDPTCIPSFEPVDAVVWSAGICELAAGQMLRLKAVRRTLAVNLEAPLVVLSYLYRRKMIRDGGVIVLLGSSSAHEAGDGFSVYAASKGGLASAARVPDKEFSTSAGSVRGVRVHCLEPGTVDTPMTRKLVETFGGLKGGLEENMLTAESVARDVVAIIESHGGAD